MNDTENKKLIKEINESNRLPKHIAFIMDGNGRWAKSRNLPRIYGHKEGVNSVREMVEAGVELGVEVMTFYTFSKENWKRPITEVSALMKLLVSTIRKEVNELNENNVRLQTIGSMEDLPEAPRKELRHAEDTLSSNTGLILNLALSYSGREEIIRAVKRMVSTDLDEINEQNFSNALDTAGLPDPDLLIRTSGESRLSNFLLWQCAYTEIFITKTFWPDFRKNDLFKAIHEYVHRERRFGCTSEQLN